MLGTSNVQKYFATGTSHYVVPAVSAEWNYNLFYPAYVTFSGTGTNLITNASSNWSPASQSDTGKYGGTALKFTSSGQSGSASRTITVPSGTNTYKVVFYAKVQEAVSVNLIAQTYLDYHRSNSSSQVIDNTQWTKFEVYVSSRPTQKTYSSFNLNLNFTAQDSSSTYNVLIDMLQMYQTTEFEYQYGNLWSTKSPFTFFRPGESYVPSGNSLTPLPSNFRNINSTISSPFTWTKAMPCSPVLYNPTILNAKKGNPIYKNGIVSEYSQYKYFVSDSTTKSLGAVYEVPVYTNKIVLKFNTAYGEPNVDVTIANTNTSYSATKSIGPSDISDAGVCILYRQTDGTWSTVPWTVMPTFNLQGSITNSQPINKIVLNQTGFTFNSAYQTYSSVSGQTEMSRLQVIEVSPRLELDLTYFTMNVSTDLELDNKQNPLPISAISSNMAQIQLSNVPLTVSNQVLSLFSNNSSSSPLKGLFKKNVKFYINYIIKDQIANTTSADKVIPGGIFYAEEWQGQDIAKTQVTAYDVSKQLQLRSVTDYVSRSENVFNVISNILDFVGFTDYNYDDLKTVTTSKKQPVVSQFFFADGANQKAFDVLRELFEVYQIGAYVDMYGVMRFLNLDTIVSNTTHNTILHDSPTPDTSLGYPITSNIVQDTYTETVKVKLGKATIKYKTPQASKTLSPDGTGNPITTSIIDKHDALWTLDKDDMTTFNYLSESITSTSQNYFKIDPNDLIKTFNSFTINHDGYVICENEIMSFSDKEFLFGYRMDGTFVPANYKYGYSAIVSNENDLKQAVTEFANSSGYGGTVDYKPSGKIANVERGLFNTPVKTHLVLDNSNWTSKLTATSGTVGAVTNGQIYLNANPLTIVVPTEEDNTNNYNTFVCKMSIGVNSDNPAVDGVGGGLILNVDSNPIYVEVRQVVTYDTSVRVTTTTIDGIAAASAGGKVKQYRLYVTQNGQSLLQTDYYDITTFVKQQSALYPTNSPFEEFGKLITLKFVKNSSSDFDIHINRQLINVKPKTGLNLTTFGRFGIFAKSTNGYYGTIPFTELYATETNIALPSMLYHYELPSFANSVVGGHRIFETNYMLQVRPQLVGINIYDVQYSLAPALSAYPLKVAYNWYYYADAKNSPTKLNSMAVRENALNYSIVYNSGFKGKVAVVNSSPAAIWLKKSPDSKNTVDVIFSINTDKLITLAEEQTISKVFDEANLSESVEIRSNWVQSKKAALGILNTVFKAIDGFSRDTEISIYGNPLFEVGDVVKVNYSLKNISNQIYFVQGVKQTFDTGLKTVLVLNQIG